MNKIIYNNEYLECYCIENKIILINSYSNTTRDTKINGKCSTEKCNNLFIKSFRFMIQYGAFCKQCTKINKQINLKKTNQIKYGVNNPFQSDSIKEKIKNTNLEKYGVENPTYSKEIRQETIKKCLQKYGVEHTCQLDIVKQRRKESIIKKYGTEYPFQSEKYKEHFKNVCLEKYGVENPQQIPEIAEKASKNSYRKKIYLFPSGKEITCQGYEPFALDKLIKEDNICEDDIITGFCKAIKNVPNLWYDDEQCKKHRHYVDIFIPSQNRCIEVKSTWTAEKKKDNIYLKQNAAKNLGYNYEIWIYNSKKQLVEIK